MFDVLTGFGLGTVLTKEEAFLKHEIGCTYMLLFESRCIDLFGCVFADIGLNRLGGWYTELHGGSKFVNI